MKSFILAAVLALTAVTFSPEAHAGFGAYNGSQNLNVFQGIRCPAGGSLSCAKGTQRGYMDISLSTAPTAAAQLTRYAPTWTPPTLTGGTSKVGAINVVYLSQINVVRSATLTGIQVLNGATVGTNKWAVALFNSSGTRVANSAAAGVTTAGVSVYQQVPFTATYTVAPGTYWLGLYVNGTTDTYMALPAVAGLTGLAGSVAGQTFGTFSNVALPTTFTADLGPIASTY